MLVAAQQTPRRDLRAKYYQHALDELKHSQLFKERAGILSGARSRAQAVLNDSDFIVSHGIRGEKPLFERLDETEFLAFVWVHELQGARQFDIYAELMREDSDSRQMFEAIAEDERFHIAYSRRELDQIAKLGQGSEVKKAIFSVKSRRWYQAWLRFARRFGDVMAGLWLGLIYLLLVGPFSLVARANEEAQIGFLPPSERLINPAEAALEQG